MRATLIPKPRTSDVVSASEIASWAWCPESWRLEKGLKLPPGNVAKLEAGERHHMQTAAVERQAQATAKGGKTLLVVGGVVLVVALVLVVLSQVR